VTPPQDPIILIVDDEPSLLTLMRFLLEEHIIKIVTASGGVQALHWLEDHKPDVILLDIMMPGMNGFEMLRRVRADKHTSLLPVIMHSTRSDRKARDESMEAGANAFFSKPAPMAELIEEIRKFLHQNR